MLESTESRLSTTATTVHVGPGEPPRMKIKMNLGGNVVEAEKMGFKSLEESWSSYKLEDGTIVRIKLVVSDVFKLPAADPLTGLPQLLVKSTNVISVEPATVKGDVH